MTMLATLAAIAALQSGWTWTLYEDGPVVLANEIPDTPQLRAILECQPGTGVARLDLFGATGAGIATIVSGTATATGQSEATADHQSVALRTDHPVFGQFLITGVLDVAVAGDHQAVAVPAGHLAKLRRFAELCSG
ncbi:hypothetical protein [Brevundimonas sp. NIBR11]|uniref:hypothetical protein n=1 Tax=Brevundimonas sp. NIBR11 TaxID=3015999 RepID=UPI0022F08F89|nr:hypothetical protein [Brevundimonas sp. NIBR11]WGM31814.1 hypothetical protein KKHFBJBL_02063 [Brevundimonas sp. NIBR11]